MSTEFAIEVTELSKHYGELKAVDKLSFQVPPGVICGFVGPNGSGKTTTMRVLATLLRPDGGTAKVFNYDTQNVIDAKQVRHTIGFMPDYFGLYNDMTGGEYLDFFAAAYRIPMQKRLVLVDDILAVVGLADKKDTLIGGLSRGMQQRLSLGRCLVHSPKLLLLDEPASGLDPRARIELMELLRELRSMGKTILISSHILSELHHLCDTVVIIERGKLVFAGTIAEASRQMRQGLRFMELMLCLMTDDAVAKVKAIAGVRNVRAEGNMLVVEFTEPLTSAELIERCLRDGIRLDEARRSEARLEEIFMQFTDGG